MIADTIASIAANSHYGVKPKTVVFWPRAASACAMASSAYRLLCSRASVWRWRCGLRRRREMRGKVGGASGVVELKIFAEHRKEVLFEAHHERMDPGVEQHVGAFETHLR